MKHLWKYLLISSLFLFVMPINGQEQVNKDRKPFDKNTFITKRNAYITAELQLTPDEAAAFIPLVDEFCEEKFKISCQRKRLNREMRKHKKLTDADYEKLIDTMLQTQIQEAELEKRYYEKFKKVLPMSKLFKYKGADHKFLYKFMNDRHGRAYRGKGLGMKSK